MTERLAQLAADLAGFAKAYPAGPEFRDIRRAGRREGYPRCCIEFYAAVIPLVWARAAEAEEYWRAAAAPGRGYVLCPACLAAR